MKTNFGLRAQQTRAGSPCHDDVARVSELLRALEHFRVEEGDKSAWARRLGFRSPREMNTACLDVLGKSIRQLEKALAAEIVQYYLAAEDKMLRELACREEDSLIRRHARWLYHHDGVAPAEPFLDRWSALEFSRPEWLARMREMFG